MYTYRLRIACLEELLYDPPEAPVRKKIIELIDDSQGISLSKRDSVTKKGFVLAPRQFYFCLFLCQTLDFLKLQSFIVKPVPKGNLLYAACPPVR